MSIIKIANFGAVEKIWAFFFVCLIAQVALILASWNRLPPQLPIFYSLPWGEKILAAKIYIIIFPAVCAVSFILNQVLQNAILRDDLYLKGVIFAFCILITFLCLFGLTKTIFLLA